MFSMRPCASTDRSLLELGEIARLDRRELDHARRPDPVVVVMADGLHHLGEARDRALRTPLQHRDLVDATTGFHDVDALGVGERLERGDRRVADAALGRVHHAAERDHVLRVDQQPQVGEHVLDLLALIEPHAAEDPVVRADAHEHVLEHAALRVRPVEDRHVGEPVALGLAQPLDLVDHEERLLVLVVGAEPHDQLARARLGPQRLRLALLVVLDQRVRRFQDVLGRAVVLLHQEDGRVGIVALEVEHVLDRRAPPAVDALVGVADDADVAVLRGEQVHELVLGAVRVLVLVDHQVREALLVVLEHLGMLAEQPHGLGDQVVEVERAGLALAPLVRLIDLDDRLLVEVARHRREVVGPDHAVLGARDGARHRPGRVPLRVEIEVLQDAGDQPFGVAVVVDREPARHAEVGVLAAEDARARRVEREDPHALGDRAPEHALDPLGHLARGLVRERDREDLERRDPVLADQVGDAVGERSGLAAARPGHDQHRPLGVQDRFRLDVVQALEQGGDGVHARQCRGLGRRGPRAAVPWAP